MNEGGARKKAAGVGVTISMDMLDKMESSEMNAMISATQLKVNGSQGAKAVTMEMLDKMSLEEIDAMMSEYHRGSKSGKNSSPGVGKKSGQSATATFSAAGSLEIQLKEDSPAITLD